MREAELICSLFRNSFHLVLSSKDSRTKLRATNEKSYFFLRAAAFLVAFFVAFFATFLVAFLAAFLVAFFFAVFFAGAAAAAFFVFLFLTKVQSPTKSLYEKPRMGTTN